ncbi:MAG: IS200/IS605 family transposase [Candidatus Cloacimonetes bacterium]|nr:IS200/IS605 family transposase [Candidatus Cloacimonadota bacterium]
MSYTQLLYHIIIRTKASKPTLSIEYSDDLYRYIWGIIKNYNSILYRINGVEDHIHLLTSIHPSISLADFIREIKVSTSKRLKQISGFEKFTGWGEGYAALTYSAKDKDLIINYINNQREHHKKISFKEEYSEFLAQLGFTLDERYWER